MKSKNPFAINRRAFLRRSVIITTGACLSACAKFSPEYSDAGTTPQACDIPINPSERMNPADFGITLDAGQQAWLVQHKVRDGNQNRKVAMLTYDDWATEHEFEQILTAFRAHQNCKTTFFFNGSHLREMAASVEKAAAEGHLIACHGWCHVNMGIYNESEINATFAAFFREMNNILPGYPLKYFRMPFGNTKDTEMDKVVLRIAAQWGLQHIYWTFYTDGTRNQVKKIVTDNLATGSIILCHMNYRYDLQYTPWMIDYILSNGYTLETIASGIDPRDQRGW